MKKRIPGILLSLALMIGMVPVFGMTAYAWEGAGTQDNPWKIGKSGSAVTAWMENKEGSETEKILHIEGTGEMADFSSENPAPWDKNITSADIGQNVTSIGNDAFDGCSDLVTVTFTPAAVDQKMKIGSDAFDQSSQILGYESGNTRLCCDDSVLQAGESLYIYNGQTLVWNISYDLWVKGTLVTETNKDNVLNDGKVSFTPEAGSNPATLTLNGATIDVGWREGEKEYGIYYTGTDTLKIELADNSVNTIEGSQPFNSGIYSTGPAAVIISGTGTLDAKGSFAGIAAANDVAVRAGNVTVTGAQGIHADHDITIEGGTLTASSTDYGLYAGRRATIIDGTVNASATGEGSYGIHAYQGFVHFMGGDVTASGMAQAVSGRVILASGVSVKAGADQESAVIVDPDEFKNNHTQKWAHITGTNRYMLWVGGTLVTDANKANVLAGDPVNDEKVVFTPAEGTDPATLTLKGANITTGYIYDQYDGYAAGIYYTGKAALNIVLQNDTDNKVKTESGSQDFENAIWSRKADITVSGGGKLTAYGRDSGIGVKTGNITIDGSTVTAGGGDNGIYIDAGVMEIKNNSIVNATGTERSGICIETGDLDIKGGTVTAAGKDKAITGDVKNAIAGTGWNNTAGEGAGEQIAVSETARELAYKKAYFGTHTHNFTYSANGEVITATCSAANCPLAGSKITMTIVKPTRTTYEGTGKAAASLDGMADFNSVTGHSVKVEDIKYKGRDGSSYDESETPPTGAGKYTAKITVEGKTASVDYEIAKADPTANAPSGVTATYGQTLSDVTLTNPDGNTPGSWTWKDSGTTNVGNVGEHTFKANFTPTDAANFKSVENVDVTINVGKAANPATVTNAASVKVGGSKVDLAQNVNKNGATGAVTYSISGGDQGCSITGSELTSGDNTGSVTVNVNVAEDGNYNASEAMPIKVTITSKDPQTITADDVTVAYGETGKKVEASTSGDGALSYEVKEGGEYIDVDKSTGMLTVKKPGSAIVTVKAAETDTYEAAAKDVDITVNKGEPTAAAVTANNRKYDGTKKPLVKADESILVGGTMQYALGNDDKTAPDKGWGESIPEAAEKGTYYVWYMVKGDANHNDSEPQSVTVTISEKGPEPVDESTITFDLNGGTLNGKTGKVTVTAANGTVITLPAPARDGYTFDYWEGSKYYAGDKYKVTEDHTLKAIWKIADKGGGSDSGSGGSDSGNNGGKNGAKTGDDNALAAWIVLLLASLTGTAGMAFARKRRG